MTVRGVLPKGPALAHSEYVCTRCGVIRHYSTGRRKPPLCADCLSLIRLQTKETR
jgi:hypothetical protein